MHIVCMLRERKKDRERARGREGGRSRVRARDCMGLCTCQGLRREVILNIFMDIVSTVPLFRMCELELQKEICLQLTSLYRTRGSVLCRAGIVVLPLNYFLPLLVYSVSRLRLT